MNELEEFKIQLKEYVKQLQQLEPFRDLQVSIWKNNVPSNRVGLGEISFSKFASYFNMRNSIHREPLTCEIILDLDFGLQNWGKAIWWARVIISRTKKFLHSKGASGPIYLYFSGSKGIHLKMFIDPSLIEDNFDLFERMAKKTLKDNSEEAALKMAARCIRNLPRLWLSPSLMAKLDQSFFADPWHLIRFCGSANIKDGKFLSYKTYLDALYPQVPKITKLHEVAFPSRLEVWQFRNPLNIFRILCAKVYQKYIANKPLHELIFEDLNIRPLRDEQKLMILSRGSGKKLEMLYKLILNQTWKDGRKRLICLLYTLAYKLGISPEDYLNHIEEWLNKQPYDERQRRQALSIAKTYARHWGRYSWSDKWAGIIRKYLSSNNEDLDKLRGVLEEVGIDGLL